MASSWLGTDYSGAEKLDWGASAPSIQAGAEIGDVPAVYRPPSAAVYRPTPPAVYRPPPPTTIPTGVAPYVPFGAGADPAGVMAQWVAGQETTMAPIPDDSGVVGEQPEPWLGAIGAVAGIVTKVGGVVLGKGLLSQLVRAGLAGGVGAAAWSAILNIFGMSPEEAIIEANKKRRKRYTIGSNPRVGTLQKVARHSMKLLKRHDKLIREFFPKKKYSSRASQVYDVMGSVLSPVEKKAISK